MNSLSVYAQNPDDHSEEDIAEEDLLLFPNEEKSPFKIKGLYKNLFIWYRTDEYIDSEADLPEKKNLITDVNRLRISPEYIPSDNCIFHADIDNEVILSSYGSSLTFDALWKPSDYNDPLPYSLDAYENEHLFYRLKVHRAYVKFSFNRFTFTGGRQLVRFGSGRLWNPLDILNPLSPTFVEGADEQKGIDALRLEYYPTEKSEIALVLSPQFEEDERSSESLKAKNANTVVRYRNTIGDTDIALLAGRIARRALYGVDVATIILDGMLRGSVLYNKPEQGESYILASGGYEYTFRNGIYILVEHFYNENSLNENEELKLAYDQSLSGTMNQEIYLLISNQFLTLNQHYSGMELSKDITPLIRGSAFTIYDYQGKTVFISPSVKWNPFEDVDIFFGVMSAWIVNETGGGSDFKDFEKSPYVYGSLAWHFM